MTKKMLAVAIITIATMTKVQTVYAGDSEKAVAAACLQATGGELVAMGICLSSGLTVNEIQKCFTGDCFGDNNDLVGKNGAVRKGLKELERGLKKIF